MRPATWLIGRPHDSGNRQHLWLFGSLHVKCLLNTGWPYWETSHNDVKSPAVCRARRLQGDRVAHRLLTISPRPAHLLTDYCMPHHPSLSPELSRWHAQPTVQWFSQPKCRITTSRVLNNWSNRPNTAFKYEIYCSYFVCHMIYWCNLRYRLLVEGLFRYNALFAWLPSWAL